MKKYETYKETGVEWIGQIPEHWNCLPMKRGMTINNGKDYKNIETETGYPVIGSGGQFAYASDYLYDGEAVLLGRKGTIDRPLYIDGKFWTVDTMFYAVPNKEVNCKYMYYQSLGIPFDKYSTSTALPSMTQSDLGNNPMCFPPSSEQQAIATFLDYKVGQIDKSISAINTEIENLRKYRQSLISKTVTKGLNPDAKMKDSGIEWIGEIPEHWNCLPMKRGMSINNGKDYKDIEVEVGYPVIGSGGQFAYASDYLYDGEAVLLGRKGTIDRPLYINGKFWTVDTMFYAVPISGVNCKYMYYQSLGIPFEKYSTSTALPSMTQSDLGNNPMCFPPLSEQQAIADYLDSKTQKIDAAITRLEQEKELQAKYKQSLISEAVTGKIDVRDWKPTN